MNSPLATVLDHQSATFHETALYEFEERLNPRDRIADWKAASVSERSEIAFAAACSTSLTYEDMGVPGAKRDVRVYSLIAADQVARRLDREVSP